MPKNVRNFWIELDVDGKASRVATGPKARNGGFTLTVKMRQNGGIITPVTIRGDGSMVDIEGALYLMINIEHGQQGCTLENVITQR